MQEYYRGKTEERGRNVLEDEEKKSWAESFLEQLNDPLIFILFVAAAISLLLREYGGKVPQAMEDLLRLPGVGRKSANLIRGDIFHLPAVVADTHCIRMANRIGFVTDTTDPVQVERALVKVLPPEESNDFCHRCVMHGRVVCTARKALCEVCCLQDVCRTGKKTIKQETLEELI